jgi:hypothetical protein
VSLLPMVAGERGSVSRQVLWALSAKLDVTFLP